MRRPSRPRRRDKEPAATVFAPLVRSLGDAIQNGLHQDPFQHDPAFVRRLLPLIRSLNLYFGTEIRGWKNVPRNGPFLIVGNHSGGAGTSDIAPLLAKWIGDRGPEAPLYSLGYDLMFSYPVVGPWLRKVGILPANHRNAREALERGAAVVVFPGGDFEVFRPWSHRNKIEFGGHKGFVQLVLATGVRVVPMTIHGAHQSTIVITRGRRIARAMGLTRLHVKVFPFVWSIPFGVAPAFVPSLQLPAKVSVEFGKPLDWSRYGPKAANNPRIVQKCYDEIIGIMQRTLDALAEEHPYPILMRLNELRPSHLFRQLMSSSLRSEKKSRSASAASFKPIHSAARPDRPYQENQELAVLVKNLHSRSSEVL